MPTIISRPATPTTVVSKPVVQSPHPVTSAFGRTGDVVAAVNDYTITQIDPEGATTGGIVVVESGQFVVKSLEIGNENVQTAAVVENDIIFFDGNGWIFSQFPDRFNAVLPINITGVDAGEVLTFDGINWVNFNLLALIGNNIDNDIAAHALLTNVHGLVDSGGGTLFLADDGVYKTITHPPDAVASVFGRTGVVIAVAGDYDIADITGLTTAGSPTDFLGADGIYKPITHPPDAISSVFGRTGVVIAVGGDYAIADITGLTAAGPGTNALFDDGTYKSIVHPPDAVDSVFGRTGVVVAANNDYTLPQIDGLIDSGPGTNFLADDGTYKVPARRDVISPSLADGTTITNAFQTVFDFSPDAVFRNNNCLITIHYQGMNVGGPATWGVHLQSLIGFTVQQNAYSAGVAQTVNSDERMGFTVTMEGIVSATGNIQIQTFADVRDHDFANSAANGKTRLTIELV